MKRPLSWTQISSFEWDKNQWYDRYVLSKKQPETKEMAFGKLVADSMGTDTPLVPFIKYPAIEYKLEGTLGGIPLIGYMDTYAPGESKMREYKTGKKLWDQSKVDAHRQIDMYLFMLYLIEGIKPEDMQVHLDCVQTKENGDFTISLVDPVVIHSFSTKRSTIDILNFGAYIKNVVKEMEEYAKFRLLDTPHTVE